MKPFRYIARYLVSRWKAILLRFALANLIFFMVKFTMDHEYAATDQVISNTTIFYYCTAVFLFLTCWEINDAYLRRQENRGELGTRDSIRIASGTMFWVALISTSLYYTALFPLREWLGIECAMSVRAQFFTDVFRALILGLAVTFFNMFSFSLRQRDEMRRQLDELRQQMMASQFALLKSQISPHFLFNSLNTLTSLMYEDRDLASDFVTRLASSYRYILDHREHDLVSLDRELAFMENYAFMMEVRHGGAVDILVDAGPDTAQVYVPTLSLQLLVENALKHNYYSRQQPLSIRIERSGHDLLSVVNNLNPRREQVEGTGFGLENIRKRYAMYTRQAVQVYRGTTEFQVKLPLLDRHNEFVRKRLTIKESHGHPGSYH